MNLSLSQYVEVRFGVYTQGSRHGDHRAVVDKRSVSCLVGGLESLGDGRDDGGRAIQQGAGRAAGPCVGWRLRMVRWRLTGLALQVREEVGTSQGAGARMCWSLQKVTGPAWVGGKRTQRGRC